MTSPGLEERGDLEKAQAVQKELIRSDAETEVVLQVVDRRHARSEEVLRFCLKELGDGTTYNALRMKLGLGSSSVDRRWRLIRRILSEMILPDSEEEALKADAAMSNYMLGRTERFMEQMKKRAELRQGQENEAQFLKLELDAMKLVMEKHSKQTEHYLKMKDLQKKEKGTRGPTIVFQNKFYVPRPGEVPKDVTPLEDAALLVAKLDDLENE